MRGFRTLSIGCLLVMPSVAQAGGPEFPAGGIRALGRGGASLARADDASVMARNPALLAELWDDQALLGAHLLLVDACFQPTGAYGWNVGEDVSDFGDGPVLISADANDRTVDGEAIARGYRDDPYPQVCHQGPAPFLPQVALSMKPSADLGVGLGFFPPDGAGLSQWGNRDGTIDTPDGKRPNPLRFLRSHTQVSFFTLLGAAGYRLTDWLSVGAAVQWNLLLLSTRTWTIPVASATDPSTNVRSDLFARDLFVPAFILSAQARPLPQLEVALAFEWTDRIHGKGKLDITTGAFGTGEVFEYIDPDRPEGNQQVRLGSAIPTTFHNRPGVIDAPPFSVPQLSLGVRYAHRLKPRPQRVAHASAQAYVEDSMASERWDVELDAVYHFTSVYDRSVFTDVSYGAPGTQPIEVRSIDDNGIVTSIETFAGKCYQTDERDECIGKPEARTLHGGKDQISLRLGGDYNVLPGLFAARAGLSYETDGQDPGMLNVLNSMLGRFGVHAGVTLRVANKTDVSLGLAHFTQREVRLQVDDESPYPLAYKSAKYHFAPGLGISGTGSTGDFDGVAAVEIPNGEKSRTRPGPLYVNAGSFFYHLEVVSLGFTQHF